MDILFIELNMKALNSLIWGSAVLAKIGIAAAVMAGVIWVIVVGLELVTNL